MFDQYKRLCNVLQQRLRVSEEVVLQQALMSLAYDEDIEEYLWHEQPCGCGACQKQPEGEGEHHG